MPSEDIIFPHIHFIVANEADRAVIFRRGPSEWSQIIAWNLKTDELEYGQRFKGRIYEERSDISPSGEFLIYFAAKFGKNQTDEYKTTWTAISRIPCLTALALWPLGHTWYGGGIFQDDNTIWLNHQGTNAQAHPDHLPHKKLVVISNKNNEYVSSENVYEERLIKHGWTADTKNSMKQQLFTKAFAADKLVHEIIFKNHKYQHTFSLLSKGEKHDLPDVEYADWDHQGRLLIASKGCLFTSQKNRHPYDAGSWKFIADLTGRLPFILKAPVAFSKW